MMMIAHMIRATITTPVHPINRSRTCVLSVGVDIALSATHDLADGLHVDSARVDLALPPGKERGELGSELGVLALGLAARGDDVMPDGLDPLLGRSTVFGPSPPSCAGAAIAGAMSPNEPASAPALSRATDPRCFILFPFPLLTARAAAAIGEELLRYARSSSGRCGPSEDRWFAVTSPERRILFQPTARPRRAVSRVA